jgi:hypothetical protein
MSAELTPLGAWLDQAEHFIRRFVVLSDDQAAAVTLWVGHTTRSRPRPRPRTYR